MADIVIDESIISYTQRMVPVYLDLTYFAQQYQALYAAFNDYSGGTKAEIDTYAIEQLKSIYDLCKGYEALSNNLMEIVDKFLQTDEQIAEFNTKMIGNFSAEVLNMFREK